MQKPETRGLIFLKKHLFIFFLIFSFSLSFSAQAEKDKSIAYKLQEHYDILTKLKADFIQVTEKKGLKMKEISKGTVYFKKPGKMYWDYKEPNGDKLISNGVLMWVLENDLMQAIETPVNKSTPPLARDFLSGIGDLKKSFNVSIIEETDRVATLELTPIISQINLNKMFLKLTKIDMLVKEIVIKDSLGTTTTVTLSNIEIDPFIKKGFFEFIVPPGVTLIRP